MKILIIGASGLVGGYLKKEFQKNGHQVVGTYNQFSSPFLFPLDITQKKRVEKLVVKTAPNWILLPAAYADVDGCEKNQALCYQINWQGIKNVVDTAKKNNLPLVFFSTDYIFSGQKGPYQEEDPPNPLNYYGKLKLNMEKYIKKHLKHYLIIRTANVFGWEKQAKNFVVRLLKNCPSKKNPVQKAKSLLVVTDQIGTPTYAGVLAKAVRFLVEKNYQGVYHIAGSQTINRYQFAVLVAKVFNLDKKFIKPTTTSQINQIALRPKKGGLKIDKVQKILPFKLPDAKKGLKMMKKEVNQL